MTTRIVTSLSNSKIQANINRAKRIVDEIVNENDHKRSFMGRSSHQLLSNGNLYLTKVIEKGSMTDGLPCFKCNKMIMPGEKCISKYGGRRGNVSFPTYFHEECWTAMYH